MALVVDLHVAHPALLVPGERQLQVHDLEEEFLLRPGEQREPGPAGEVDGQPVPLPIHGDNAVGRDPVTPHVGGEAVRDHVDWRVGSRAALSQPFRRGNRHCPKCQATAAARWLETQAADLLDTPSFHVVFSLPRALGPMALSNPRVVYGLLMRVFAQTLLEVAANPKHLGAEVGVLEVLHTWGQNLALHPHVHCVVTGGGLSLDESRWIAGRDDYFLPVPILRCVFRGKFLSGLRTAFQKGLLRFPGRLAALARPARFHRLLDETVRTEWVVYAKPPTKGPATVLKYLARYTHKTAISNSRLVSLTDDQVTFRWTDYTHGGRRGTITLEAVEFVRRFLMHVLPSGFVRVRHYGLLANRILQKAHAEPTLTDERWFLSVCYRNPATHVNRTCRLGFSKR